MDGFVAVVGISSPSQDGNNFLLALSVKSCFGKKRKMKFVLHIMNKVFLNLGQFHTVGLRVFMEQNFLSFFRSSALFDELVVVVRVMWKNETPGLICPFEGIRTEEVVSRVVN